MRKYVVKMEIAENRDYHYITDFAKNLIFHNDKKCSPK